MSGCECVCVCFGPFVAGQQCVQLLWIPALHLLCVKLKVGPAGDKSSVVVTHTMSHTLWDVFPLERALLTWMRTQEPTSPLRAAEEGVCVCVSLLNVDLEKLKYFYIKRFFFPIKIFITIKCNFFF